jgi:hypothetical protein
MGCMSEIYDQLRQAIRTSDKSRYKLWLETGIDQAQLVRFMAGESGLSVENTEKLIEALGLEVILRPKASGAKAEERKVKHGKRNQ